MKKIKLLLLMIFCCLTLSSSYSQTISGNTRNYTGAEIISTSEFRYGKIAFRMRAVRREGVLSNFFTYKQGSEQDNNLWEEIDLEIFGKNNATQWQSNVIFEEDINGVEVRNDENDQEHLITDRSDNQIINQLDRYSSGFTTFRIEWKPESIKWFENDILVRELTGEAAEKMRSAHTFRFNIWAATLIGFAGDFREGFIRQPNIEMQVDYLRYYPLNDDGSFATNPAFEDDFSGNSLDSSKWFIANHTFDVNFARFRRENVRVANGRLFLRFAYGVTTSDTDNTIDRSALNAAGKLNTINHSQLSVYPNPMNNRGILNIQTNTNTGGTVQLIDLNGKRIYTNQFETNATTININNLAISKGIYILNILTTNKTESIKLIL